MSNRPEPPAIDDFDRPVFWRVKQPGIPARKKPSHSLSKARFYYSEPPVMNCIGQLLTFLLCGWTVIGAARRRACDLGQSSVRPILKVAPERSRGEAAHA